MRGPRGGFVLTKQELARQLDAAIFPGMQGGPLMHIIAAKAIAFGEAMKSEFVAYQRAVVENAKVLASELQGLGFRLVSGGTDTHLILIDLQGMGITGKVAEQALAEVGISVNRNSIPFDTRPPQIATGLRLGTAAVTTRGLGPPEMKQIAYLIYRVLTNLGDERVKQGVCREVAQISSCLPVPTAR
jgi:glycine hydroxymethyltransferase